MWIIMDEGKCEGRIPVSSLDTTKHTDALKEVPIISFNDPPIPPKDHFRGFRREYTTGFTVLVWRAVRSSSTSV
jgi:hypothetical protein